MCYGQDGHVICVSIYVGMLAGSLHGMKFRVQGLAFRVCGSGVLEVTTRFNLSVVGAKKRVVEARNAFL